MSPVRQSKEPEAAQAFMAPTANAQVALCLPLTPALASQNSFAGPWRRSGENPVPLVRKPSLAILKGASHCPTYPGSSHRCDNHSMSADTLSALRGLQEVGLSTTLCKIIIIIIIITSKIKTRYAKMLFTGKY